MKITSRFTVAVHTLLVIYKFAKEHKTTSEFIASSVNVHPVVIRRTLGSLKEAGLVEVRAGFGGASLAKLFSTYIKRWTAWRTVFFISTKVPIPPAPWEKISTAYWTGISPARRRRWRNSSERSRSLPWRKV